MLDSSWMIYMSQSIIITKQLANLSVDFYHIHVYHDTIHQHYHIIHIPKPFSHRQNITQLTIFQPTLLSSSSEFLKFAGRSKKHPETQTHSAQCWNGCVFHSQPHWTWTLVPGWTTSQQCLSAGYIGESYIGWEEQLSRKRNWPCFKKCLYF